MTQCDKGVLNTLSQQIHEANRKWWFDKEGNKLTRNKGEMLMLVVSEIAEAMEGERKRISWTTTYRTGRWLKWSWQTR